VVSPSSFWQLPQFTTKEYCLVKFNYYCVNAKIDIAKATMAAELT
jgi:hypothetical protein